MLGAVLALPLALVACADPAAEQARLDAIENRPVSMRSTIIIASNSALSRTARPMAIAV